MHGEADGLDQEPTGDQVAPLFKIGLVLTLSLPFPWYAPSHSQKCRTQERCVCLEVSPAVLSELPHRLHACPLSLTLVLFVLSCGPP